MGSMWDATESILTGINTYNSAYNDYLQTNAEISTRNKKIQLQNDINAKLRDIQQSSDFEKWNSDVTIFYDQIKSGMGDKNSPYYCRNNLEARQFQAILDESNAAVSEKVAQMTIAAQNEKDVLDTQNATALIFQTKFGQDAVDEANKGYELLYKGRKISRTQYENQKDMNYLTGVGMMWEKAFEDSYGEAIAQGKSAEAFYSDLQHVIPKLRATDADGMEKSMDLTNYEAQLKKKYVALYDAKVADMQQENANKLAAIVQDMRQQETAEGKLNVARRGQMVMNTMAGMKLSENDRLQYSAIFDLNMKGTGRGSGAKSSDFDSYEKLIKAAPDTAVQLIEDGTVGNPYEAIKVVSSTMQNNWFNKNYSENFDKNAEERDETFNLMYKGQTSEESITDVIAKRVLEKYPSAQNLVNNNYKNLLTDIQKNPKKYGTATVGALADFMTDWALGADKNATDEDFINAFNQHINDCYVESVKYVELDKKGKLEKKFNANSEKDIAKAARLASEKDYVFTYQGQERWAEGKKEALEAEGGIVDVLKSAVAGTLDVPESERGSIGYYYKPDAEHDDMTSTPIITYKNKAYEVIPNEGDKGFKLREVHTGEVIDGKLGGAKAKEERKEQKAEAKSVVSAAHDATRQVEEKRVSNTNEAIANTKEMPKAMKGAGGVKSAEWETGNQTEKQVYLQDTENAINKDYKKVKNKKMTQEEFREKYGIYFYDWDQTSEKTARYNLILNSR